MGIETLQRILGFDDLARLCVLERLPRTPAFDFIPPGSQRLAIALGLTRLPDLDDVFQDIGAIADDRNVDRDVLVD